MPTEVIDTVHTLAKNDKAKEGINYDEGIPAPDHHDDVTGVDTDDAGVRDNDENREVEIYEDENFENYNNHDNNVIENYDP